MRQNWKPDERQIEQIIELIESRKTGVKQKEIFTVLSVTPTAANQSTLSAALNARGYRSKKEIGENGKLVYRGYFPIQQGEDSLLLIQEFETCLAQYQSKDKQDELLGWMRKTYLYRQTTQHKHGLTCTEIVTFIGVTNSIRSYFEIIKERMENFLFQLPNRWVYTETRGFVPLEIPENEMMTESAMTSSENNDVPTVSAAALKKFLEQRYLEKNVNTLHSIGVSTYEILVFCGIPVSKSKGAGLSKHIKELKSHFQDYNIAWKCVQGCGWLPTYEVVKSEALQEEPKQSDLVDKEIVAADWKEEAMLENVHSEEQSLPIQESEVEKQTQPEEPVLWGKTAGELDRFLAMAYHEKLVNNPSGKRGISTEEVADFFGRTASSPGQLQNWRGEIRNFIRMSNLQWECLIGRGFVPTNPEDPKFALIGLGNSTPLPPTRETEAIDDIVEEMQVGIAGLRNRAVATSDHRVFAIVQITMESFKVIAQNANLAIAKIAELN